MNSYIKIIILIPFLLFSSIHTIAACDEEQTNTYITQILFGNDAYQKKNNPKLQMLLDAVYLNSMQSNNQGEKQINRLKSNKIRKIGSISDINIKNKDLLECSHNSWNYESTTLQNQQITRKNILQKTVNKVFKLNIFDRFFSDKADKCNSFAILLYYSHILADYLADNPNDTRVLYKDIKIPPYVGNATIILNKNKPSFTPKQQSIHQSFYRVSQLDNQNRVGIAIANIGIDTIENIENRKSYVSIKPSGWHQNKYTGLVTSNPPYLLNRCHLIAHQLGGKEEEGNLITGTRYLNESMIPYENAIKQYILKTKNHVLYKVTPIFKQNNNFANGLQLEATSIEDSGKGLCFNVFCYNVQPGISINYTNGENIQKDNLINQEHVIPFVVKNPSENEPDLIYEMNKHLEILFKHHKNTYKSMQNKIKKIANCARNIDSTQENAYNYIELKKYQYEYLEILKTYVPILLQKEPFFNSVFKENN